MENRQWTEQECKDAANGVCKTDADAIAYYEHFGAVGFVDGCGRAIKNLQLHMQKCKRAGWWPGESGKTKTKRLTLPGKNCNKTTLGIKCRKSAVYRSQNDFGYDIFRCEEHLPEGA